jgi:tellurite resistance protein TerC
LIDAKHRTIIKTSTTEEKLKVVLFPFQDFWWLYLGFLVFVLFMLALDLGVFHKKAHEVSFKEASLWTAAWISLALVFNFCFYLFAKYQFSANERFASIPGFDPGLQAKTSSLEFLTGFVVEKALAVDNIFIFSVVFAYFGIPKIYQHRVLFWGILGALIFRGVFIGMGSVLMQYHAVIIFFGALLILTGVKMFFSGTKPQNLEDNFVLRNLKKVLRVHPKLEGQKFFVRKKGLLYVTPLFLSLIFLEITDVIFAVDSVPAIFALTKEPLIVFTSNIFAMMGLRSMYFMLAGVLDKFSHIKYGLSLVLVFVGLKMVWLNEAFGGKFPIHWSLAIIVLLIGSSIAVSLVINRKNKGVLTYENV